MHYNVYAHISLQNVASYSTSISRMPCVCLRRDCPRISTQVTPGCKVLALNVQLTFVVDVVVKHKRNWVWLVRVSTRTSHSSPEVV